MTLLRDPRDPAPSALPVTHVLRREHDGSLISEHHSLRCALNALDVVSLAAMMGEHPPGPLEAVTTHLVDVISGQAVASAGGLVPSDGVAPPEVMTWC